MLRILAVLVVATACASSASPVAKTARAPDVSSRAASRLAAENAETRARLAPPFGRSAGVRRVTEATEVAVPAAPAVLAAAERDE